MIFHLSIAAPLCSSYEGTYELYGGNVYGKSKKVIVKRLVVYSQ